MLDALCTVVEQEMWVSPQIMKMVPKKFANYLIKVATRLDIQNSKKLIWPLSN